MKRTLSMGLLIGICFVLQNTLMNALSLASIKPNLLLILTASFGFMRGRKSGMWTGFFCGLLLDIFYGDILGFYTLIYMYIGFFNGYFKKGFYPQEVKLPLVLISVSDISYGLVIYITKFLLKGKFEIMYYTLRIILPELIYTLVFSIPLYWMILRIHSYFEKQEDRRR